MKFKCIETVEFPWFEANEPIWHKESSPLRYPFIKGKTYGVWDKTTSRTTLALISESGGRHGVGQHLLHWKFDKFFKKHFIEISDDGAI